ncbi:hypothetical protein SDIAM26S_03115 [Streptomyces diastaticus subsp. diastaticus]
MLPAEASGTSMAASGYRVALALAVPLSLRGPARRARARGGMRRGAPARRRARLRPYAAAMAIDLTAPPANFLAFWREKHVCTLTTPRPDGTPHVVPVGVTYDPGERLARIITGGATTKVRHVRAAGDGGARVAVCQPAGTGPPWRASPRSARTRSASRTPNAVTRSATDASPARTRHGWSSRSR